METKNLDDVAIIIRPEKDNVAVVTVEALEAGTSLRYGNEELTVPRRAVRGQSLAVKPIVAREAYISLGDPVGMASRNVEPGEPIDASNLQNRLPRLRVRYRDNPQPNELDPELSSLTFEGFLRPDGSVGIRNFVGVVNSVMCSAGECREIAARAMREIYTREKFPNVDGVVAVIQESGCGQPDGAPVQLLNQLFVNTLRHPNLGAVVYVDLGCDKTCLECSGPVFQRHVPQYNQRVAPLSVQAAGGGRKTVQRGLEIVEQMLHYANQFKRVPLPISKLILGTECGGSDRWSGVTANPALGYAADLFVKAGAAVFLPEITELQGAAMIDLARRARTRAVGRKLMDALKRYEKYVRQFGCDIRENPSPGNIKGGLYNIYLKSSGAKAKGGTSIVEDLIDYGEWLGERKGLYVLYTPGYDQVCTPALFLSGAQVAVFTTGRGTGIGCALGPVIKVATNSQTGLGNGDIDINAGTILDRTETLEQVGRKIFQEILDVASGRKFTRAEESGYHTEFKVWESLWPTL